MADLFMSMLIIYLMSSWLPTLLNNSGITLARASFVTAMFQVGGTIIAILLGRWMDRLDPHWVLGGAYLLATGFIALIGMSGGSLWLLGLAVFGAGFCVSGSQVGANALAAAFYPTGNRATAARCSARWSAACCYRCSSPTSRFLLVAVPALVSAIAVSALGWHRQRSAMLPTFSATHTA